MNGVTQWWIVVCPIGARVVSAGPYVPARVLGQRARPHVADDDVLHLDVQGPDKLTVRRLPHLSQLVPPARVTCADVALPTSPHVVQCTPLFHKHHRVLVCTVPASVPPSRLGPLCPLGRVQPCGPQCCWLRQWRCWLHRPRPRPSSRTFCSLLRTTWVRCLPRPRTRIYSARRHRERATCWLHVCEPPLPPLMTRSLTKPTLARRRHCRVTGWDDVGFRVRQRAAADAM